MRRLRVLYVTDRFDAPYRFRCQQACEQLRREGAVANVAHVDEAPSLPELGRYGVIVLFRLPWSRRVEQLVLQARTQAIPVLFDIDDLTFDSSLAALMTFRRRFSADEWARTYGTQMTALRRTIDACDAFIGSTAELAEHAVRLGKTAYVHPNVAPTYYLKAGNAVSRGRGFLRTYPTIGYFSGSNTHDEDFASIAPALSRVFEAMPSARLLVVGHLTLGGSHRDIESRTVRLPYMHWRDFALAYAACHVTLAPLMAINAFTNSKSALKFFEAGAFHTPVVATPVREMASAIRHGESGFLANDTEEWFLAVTRALDPDTSVAMGRAARRDVEARHSTEAVAGRLFDILDRHAIRGEGTPPGATPLEAPDEAGTSRLLGRALRPGRAIVDVVDIVRAARTGPGPRVDAESLDAFLDAATDDAASRPDATALGVTLFDAAAIATWHKSDQITAEGGATGEWRSRGTNPQFLSAPLAIDPKKHRFLVLRLRVLTAAPAVRAQVYWAGSDGQFEERASTSFTVAADGFDQSYVVDLGAPPLRGRWRRHETITRLRLDPMDRAGAFRVDSVMLAPEGLIAILDARPPVDRGRLAVDRDAHVTSLHDAFGEADTVTVRIRGQKARAREVLFEAARASDAYVQRLFLDRDGAAIATVKKHTSGVERGVDIVVPIFNARALTLQCISSVLRHATGDYRLVLVDDKSTDPSMLPSLRGVVSSHPRVVLLENTVNLGFVGTANRGLRHAAGRDVVLLNSDTEVFSGFRERLERAAYSDARAGMASPLSNNATICSVPEFCRENTLPPDVTRAEMAELVASASEKSRPELVTPHGFCMYIRADCLADVGYLDEELFGRGFGEENDFGERAKEKHWRILLADDVYVWHEGKASFSDEGHALERRHAEILERRHPGYHAAVATFVRDNPLSAVHRSLDRHLKRRSHRVEPAPMFVVHANPFSPTCGGVEHCLRDLIQALQLPRAVVVFPDDGALVCAEVFDGDLEAPLFYDRSLESVPSRFCLDHAEVNDILEEWLDLFRIGWVHIHHLMNLPISFASALARKGIPYLVTVHDFYAVCPSFNLLDFSRMALCCPGSCGDAARATSCQRALAMQLGEVPPSDAVAYVDQHRRAQRELLSGAERVLFPSESTMAITSKVTDVGERGLTLPHGYTVPELPPKGPSGAALRIALVGQIAYASKGAAAYLETMALVAAESVDVEWHVFGRTDIFGFDAKLDALSRRVQVIRHDEYRRDTIIPQLRRTGIDVALLLPAWPETYSYTLTEVMAARVPVIANRMGALEDRLRGASCAILVGSVREAAAAVTRLARNRGELGKMERTFVAISDTASWADAHRSPYGDCQAKSPVHGPVAATATECQRLNAMARNTPFREPLRAVSVTAPAPEVAATWWYRYANRAKPHVPEAVRHIVRRRLARDGSVPVVRFRFPGPQAPVGPAITLNRRYLGTALFTSHGDDPQFPLSIDPLDPETVNSVRFNMWCHSPGAIYAQLYWKHRGAREFTEAHSLLVPLDGRAGEWQEYVARFDVSDKAAAWYEGGPIVSLRFDPLNVPGMFGLGELALCGTAGNGRRRP
jgi:GT2 family glycosyltransferase